MLVESVWYLIRAGKQILGKKSVCYAILCSSFYPAYFIPNLKSSCLTATAGIAKVNKNCLPEMVAAGAQGGHPSLTSPLESCLVTEGSRSIVDIYSLAVT